MQRAVQAPLLLERFVTSEAGYNLQRLMSSGEWDMATVIEHRGGEDGQRKGGGEMDRCGAHLFCLSRICSNLLLIQNMVLGLQANSLLWLG